MASPGRACAALLGRVVAVVLLCAVLCVCCGGSALFVSAEGADCVIEPAAWVLLRFNLQSSGGGTSGGQSPNVQIEVDRGTLSRLESLTSKLALISIIGPYRTGKSTLLNRLMPDNVPSRVFSVGHTVQPHTEEVSLYVLPACAVSQLGLPADTALVFVDTPGLFAPNRVGLFDAQLLAILNLISSVVIYHNMGVIKRVEVEQLSDAVEAAFALSYYGDADTSNSSASIDRPHLIWVMNNLQVELKDRDGHDLTTKAYIQSVLNEIDTTSNSSTSYSARFNRFFASLDSFALPYPTSNFADANKLSDMTEEQFTADYREQRNTLKQRALSLVQPKRLGANLLVGAMLASLIDSWTQNVNIPVDGGRQNSASALMRHINEKEVAKAVARYKERMRAVSLPLTDSALRQAHDDAVAAVLSGVKVSDLPDFAALFGREMNSLYTEYVKLNEGNVRAILDTKLQQHTADWQLKVKERKAAMPQQPSALLLSEEQQKARWRSDTQSVRLTAASIIAEYDNKLAAVVESSRKELLTLSLAAYKDKMKRTAEEEAKLLSLPGETAKVDGLFDGLVAQWEAVVASFTQLDTDSVTPYSHELQSHLTERRQYWQSENLKESVRLCSEEASKMGRRLLRDSEQWSSDERFQSVAALNRWVDRLQDDKFCVGPGRADAKVVYQLYKARREVGDSIRQRTSTAQTAYAAAALFAVYAVLLARRALTARHGHATSQSELLGYGDGANNGSLSPTLLSSSSSVPLSVVQRAVLLLSAVLAAALLYAHSLIPDSATGMWLHGLWLLSAALLACSVVGLWYLIAGHTGRAGKANHEH